MLQYSTVESGTLDLLKELMSLPQLNSFYLVGGTALSLYLGHRISVDLDLFSTDDFSPESLMPILSEHFSSFEHGNINNPVGLFSFINNVKVDMVKHHQFKLIEPPVEVDGIRMFSIPDIMAMKIAAIMKRAVKKDFWDIAELLQQYPVQAFIDYYNSKYPNQQILISIPQVMTYFADAEESEDPVSLNGQTWDGVKKIIRDKVREYLS